MLRNFTASANKTFYAHWTANKYTITYNANGIGSTPSPSTKQITFDSTYGDLPSMSNTYYTFDGWYDAATGGTKITSSTKVTTPAIITPINDIIINDLIPVFS